MTDKAVQYLCELAGLELSGTQRFSEHEFYLFYGNNEITDEADAINLYPPFAGLTYEGMSAASAENLIEIQKDEIVIQSISNNREVYEFLTSLNTSEWTCVGNIPESSSQVCTVVRYQSGRRGFEGQMMEQSRLILYHDSANYYMDILIADNENEQRE